MLRGKTAVISFSEKLLGTLGTIFKVALGGAVFGCLATTFVVHAADVDLTIGGTYRSYPLSGVIEAEGGYNLLLWGDPATPFHGYLRPRLNGSSAVTYNSVDGAFEIFPVAFLGARAGGESVQNDHPYTAYDCIAYRCEGRFYRAYFEAELSLGAGPIFVHGRWRRERWTQGESVAYDFIDPTSGLAMRATGDMQTVYYAVAGLKLSPVWSLLVATRYAESSAHDFSRMPFAMLRYRSGGLTVSAGGGTFESTLKKREPTAAVIFRWEIAPSLALH